MVYFSVTEELSSSAVNVRYLLSGTISPTAALAVTGTATNRLITISAASKILSGLFKTFFIKVLLFRIINLRISL